VKFGHVVFEICEQTGRQTHMQSRRHTNTKIAILRTLPGGDRINNTTTIDSAEACQSLWGAEYSIQRRQNCKWVMVIYECSIYSPKLAMHWHKLLKRRQKVSNSDLNLKLRSISNSKSRVFFRISNIGGVNQPLGGPSPSLPPFPSPQFLHLPSPLP